jgi:hypothetical protein
MDKSVENQIKITFHTQFHLAESKGVLIGCIPYEIPRIQLRFSKGMKEKRT